MAGSRWRLTFLATEEGRGGSLQATVVDDPPAGEMINLYRMLLSDGGHLDTQPSLMRRH